MPCLGKATAEGQEARVMSILGPGTGSALDATDLGLKKHFSLMRAARQVPTYNDIFVEVGCLLNCFSFILFDAFIHFEQEYADRHPTMSFIHARPGTIDSSLTNSAPFYLRAFVPLIRPFLTTIEDCGEWMGSALNNPEMKKGAWYISPSADPISKSWIHSDEASRKTLVEHFKQEMAPF